MLVDNVGELVDKVAALRVGDAAPCGRREGGAGGLDGAVDVLGGRGLDLGDDGLVGRVDAGYLGARGRLDELIVDEEARGQVDLGAVGRREVDDGHGEAGGE